MGIVPVLGKNEGRKGVERVWQIEQAGSGYSPNSTIKQIGVAPKPHPLLLPANPRNPFLQHFSEQGQNLVDS